MKKDISIKWIIIFFVSIVVVLFGYAPQANASVGRVYINTKTVSVDTGGDGSKYIRYKTPEITIIQPKKFSFIFQTEWSSAYSLVRNGQCVAALNGTYFGRNDNKTFFPAGIRYAFGSLLSPIYQPATDPNLKVLLWSDWQKILFTDNDTFDFRAELLGQPQRSWYLNTWPWLVRDGKINHSVVDFTSHWQRSATRSWILVHEDGSISFLIATQPITLPQFVTFVYTSWLGSWKFQFVNIDGGSSTSLRTPYNSYYSQKLLPAFICIQK